MGYFEMSVFEIRRVNCNSRMISYMIKEILHKFGAKITKRLFLKAINIWYMGTKQQPAVKAIHIHT